MEGNIEILERLLKLWSDYWFAFLITIALIWIMWWSLSKLLNSFIWTIKALQIEAVKTREEFKDELKILWNSLTISIKELQLSIWLTVLSTNQIVSITKSLMWRQSEPKLNFLKDLLIKNSIQERKEILKKQIRAELERLSMFYITELNEHNSKVGRVWDWVLKNFDMTIFLEELYEIFFRIEQWDTELIISRKINDIKSIMLEWQHNLAKELYNQLNHNE